jgi:hypothetical protein
MKYCIVVMILILGVVLPVDAQTAPEIEGCVIFPPDHIWNTRTDTLPLDPNSDLYLETIGDHPLHADFGSGLWEGEPIGIPFNVVDGDQPLVEITFIPDWGVEESDPGPYPIPPDALIEGGGDRHVLVLEKDNCILYELYNAEPQDDGTWHADSGAVFDLKGYELRDADWTSADAAGLPILPGLVRYDEVASGAIHHAIRFTLPETRREYIWHARHYASDLTDQRYPPMGQRFRLRADFDLSGFSPEGQVILRAMQQYGIILADNGSPMFISGVPDERWDNDLLHEDFERVSSLDFEAVDVSSLMIDSDSGQARQVE